MGSISFGTDFVAGSMRVPSPAARMTAVVTGCIALMVGASGGVRIYRMYGGCYYPKLSIFARGAV